MTENVLKEALSSMAKGATLSLLPRRDGGEALAQVRKMTNGWLTVDNKTFSGADANLKCAEYLTTTYPNAEGYGIFKVM